MKDKEYKLIKKCSKGDLNAFEELIKKHEKKAFNIALKMLKNRDDAMDISQEAFIKVYKSIGSFNFKSSFSTWLYRVVVNTCLDFIKKEKKIVYSIDNPIQTKDGEIHREIEDNKNIPEDIFEKKLNKQLVHNSIQKLNDIHKTAIILRDIEGFTYKEISEITDCSLGTVKSRIKRGRDYLKHIIVKEMKQSI